MEYLLTPYAERMPPFAWWDGAFNDQELNWLQNKAKQADQNAKVGNNDRGIVSGILNPNIRRSQVSWLPNNNDTEWVFNRLAAVANQINAEHFGFDLVGFGEPLQLTNYDQSENGMYGWHQDYGVSVSRKLSLSVQLSDPSEYEGGKLQVLTTGEPIDVSKKRGMITIFPSYVLHQVTPVTQGSRQSLVTWISGPAFK